MTPGAFTKLCENDAPPTIDPMDVDPEGGGYWLGPDGTLYDVDAAMVGESSSHLEWAAHYGIDVWGGDWLRVVASDGNLYWQGTSANNAQLRVLKDAARSAGPTMVRDRRPM